MAKQLKKALKRLSIKMGGYEEAQKSATPKIQRTFNKPGSMKPPR